MNLNKLKMDHKQDHMDLNTTNGRQYYEVL